MDLKIFLVLSLAVTGCGAEPPSGEALDCVYVRKATAANPDAEFASAANCAVREEGEIRIERQHLEALDFDARGLGTMVIAGQWHYVRPDGANASVVTWDNGADDFAEGLARTLMDGKIAYLDEHFEVVVPPRYDWGWPFEDGLALVCRDCRREQAPGEEHTAVVGGIWGFIDRAGNEVVTPFENSREQAREELLRHSASAPKTPSEAP